MIERFSAALESVGEQDEPGAFTAIAASKGVASSAHGPVRFSKEALRAMPSEVPLLLDHRPDEPLGLASLHFDPERGLVARGKLALSLPKARETRALMLAGALNGVSIGFDPHSEHWENGVRVVDRATVREMSIVCKPADPCARVMHVHRGVAAEELIAHYTPQAEGRRTYELVRSLQAGKRRSDWT